MEDRRSGIVKQRSSVSRGFKSPLIRRQSAQEGTPESSVQTEAVQSPAAQRCRGRGEVCDDVNNDEDDDDRLKAEVKRLRRDLHSSQQEIAQLRNSGIDESELVEYIKKLHEYNDLKDIGQMVMGNIATIRGVRTRDLYPNYGLELDD